MYLGIVTLSLISKERMYSGLNVVTRIFWYFFEKCKDVNNLKFDKALSFYIHPSLGTINVFQLYSFIFHPNLATLIYILNENGI